MGALPWRQWCFNIVARTLHCYDDDNSCNCIGDYTNEHIAQFLSNVCYVGAATSAGPMYNQWMGVFRCESDDFELADGMDEVCDYGFMYSMWLDSNSAGATSFTFYAYQLDDPTLPTIWNSDLVTGKHYDGVHAWNSYPPNSHNHYDNQATTIASLPVKRWNWCEAYATGHRSNQYQDEFFALGVMAALHNYVGVGTPFPNPGDECTCYLAVHALKVNYLNPVVNSIERMYMPACGGVTLVLSGLGFDQDDCDLADNDRYPLNNCAPAWNSIVDFIYFEGLQGQGTTTLSRLAGDFNVVSDTQITIPSMPALAAGTYHVRLLKQNVGVGAGIGNVEAYAGDWRCGVDGQVRQGSRFSFFVGDYVDPPRPPLLGFKWRWIIGGIEVDAYYAPIDICAPETFWDGRVISVSTLKRSIDDFTGLFNISDVNVDLASHDLEFQKLLAQGYCKNQLVEIAHAWATEPAGWMEQVFHGIVDDHDLQGPSFPAVLKDISRKHFRKKMPRYTITEEDWPNAHENALGQGVPELIGVHSHTTGSNPGAIEAHCVDTTTFTYLAAAGPISIPQVYSAASLMGAATYSVFNDANGFTYIRFNNNQGDNKITFNCAGYSWPDWDSANGTPQNPAYVLLFYLLFICQVPINFINLDSFNTVAQQFEDMGYDEIGRWAGVEIKDADAYLQELLFSFGIKIWPDRYGRFTVGRKDITNWQTDRLFWAQIDTEDAPLRKYNLMQAINYVKARWDYQPAASLYHGAVERESESAIEDYKERNEVAWDYPWVSDDLFVQQRINEDFAKLAHGHRTVSFALPLEYITEIDIFDNFRLQDMYDLNPLGTGEVGRYYYITSLEYDWMGARVIVEAEDMQWLVGQCFIVGRCSELNNSWADASPWMRIFGYVGDCTTNRLPGNSPLKLICPCGD